METKNRIITIFTYIVRALLAYVYIPHGLEKLYTKINVQEFCCHVFISHARDFLIFDLLVLTLNLYLILLHFRSLANTFFKPQKTWI
jgi:uncharacterized membrane protein YphA (DoxX/SURF4 family)